MDSDLIFVSTVIYYDISGVPLYTNVAVYDISGTVAYVPQTDLVPNIPETIDVSTWVRENRLLGEEHTMCPISFETIEINDTYCVCDVCTHPFTPALIEIALRRSYTCPHCRTPWTNCVVYTNAAPV
jgi:hypothetical protein